MKKLLLVSAFLLTIGKMPASDGAANMKNRKTKTDGTSGSHRKKPGTKSIRNIYGRIRKALYTNPRIYLKEQKGWSELANQPRYNQKSLIQYQENFYRSLHKRPIFR